MKCPPDSNVRVNCKHIDQISAAISSRPNYTSAGYFDVLLFDRSV